MELLDIGEKMSKEKLWTKNYTSLCFTNIITSFSFYMIVTVLISFLTGSSVGATSAVAGVISGLFSVTSLICRPFCGALADRFSKVKLMRIAVLMMAAGCFAYTISNQIAVIVLARIIHGVGFAVSSTAIMALTTEYIPHSRMGEGIGYIGLANVIASAAAPGFGIYIAGIFGLKGVFYVAGILCVIASVLFFLLKDEKKNKTAENRKHGLGDLIAVSALSYTLVGGTLSFTNGVISTYLLTYSRMLGISNIGIYFTINAIVLFLVRPFAGKLTDRKGLYIVAFPGLICATASMFMLAAANHFPQACMMIILFSGVIRALGQGSVQPALQTECIKQVGKERSGVATSTFYLGGDVGQGIGPMAAGVIIGAIAQELMAYQAVFGLCGVLLILATGVMVRIYWKQNKWNESRK